MTDVLNHPHGVDCTIITRDNQLLDDFVVKDDEPTDKGDFYTIIRNKEDYSTEYIISQYYLKNSDGGVIGPLEGTDFTITIYVDEPGNIESTVVVFANGDTLQVTDEVTLSL